ncbi:MAG TPA: von Willebrand factor type A domain-containing protein [Chthoniobacteraceae bacterium]|jgi:Ca-activated chloride channel family protein
MNPDDPKLTAYALDELDPTERAEIESLLRDDPALAAELEATAMLAAQLRRELKAEPTAPLTNDQRAEVLAASSGGARDPRAAASDSPGASVSAPLQTSEPARSARLANETPARSWSRPFALAASIAVLATVTYLAVQSTHAPQAPRSLADLGEADEKAPAQPSSAARQSSSAPLPDEAAKDLALPTPTEGIATAAKSNPVTVAVLPPLNKALSAAAPEGNSEVAERLLAQAKTPDDSGRPDLAFLHAEPTLALNRNNVAAGEMQMKIGGAIDQAAAAGRREMQSQPPAKADQLAGAPETAIPKSGARSLAGTSDDLGRDKLALAMPSEAPTSPAARAAESKQSSASDAAAPSSGELFGSNFAGVPASSQPASPVPQTADGPVPGRAKGIADGLSRSRMVAGRTAGGAKLEYYLADEEVDARRDRRWAEGELRKSGAGNTEAYDAITDNVFLAVRENPLSTFSIDVDTASYSNVRRFLNQQKLPPKGAVRIEEMINYFDYDYPQPEGDAPFSATMEVAACPWKPEHRLVRVGLKGREIARDRRPASNLVFLIDVSGSMQPENKLPLLKKSLRMLVDQLSPEDTVSIAVYAGASGCVLEPTNKKSEIRAALDKLESGGSTNGASGIKLAYDLAAKSFIKGGANRVILATDGDFNVGVTNQSDLVELIEKKAKTGVFLTVLGFGMDNLKDSTLEKLADKGNGNYAYIDTLLEGKKVLVDQMSGTLVTIAKDVKIQVEFNPSQAAAYRLIGYENRMLRKEDFNDDTKDAGEIGAGHTVTALYEVVPAGKEVPGVPGVDELKYQRLAKSSAESPAIVDAAKTEGQSAIAAPAQPAEKTKASSELLTVKLRYKAPDSDTSKLLEFPLTDEGKSYERSSKDFRFASAVASFGMLLRDSPHKGSANWSSTLELAAEGKGEDRHGYRAEFVGLVERAKAASR